MFGLALVAASLAPVLPCEYHIDCSAWDGAATVEFGGRVAAEDGSAHKTTVQLFPRSASEDARGLIWFGLEENKWRRGTVGEGVLILTGIKGCGGGGPWSSPGTVGSPCGAPGRCAPPAQVNNSNEPCPKPISA